MNRDPTLLDVVALTRDEPSHGLTVGQVGTIVERLDERTFLVEFSDDRGVAYALAPIEAQTLLVLRYAPLAA